MMNTWLMRRPVRRPVSRATTAPSSSSVCRLPFMSSSACPRERAPPPWRPPHGCAARRRSASRPRSMPLCFATSSILAAGPTRMGVISPLAPASSAAASAVDSQGWATAVGIGSRLRQRASTCSYFPVPCSRVMAGTNWCRGLRPNRRPRLSQEKCLRTMGARRRSREARRPGGRASRGSRTPPGHLRMFPCTWRSSPWR